MWLAVSSPVAAIAPDAVLTAYHAVKTQARVGPGMTVIIYGLGGLGSNAVQIAMHLGAKRILVVDRRRSAVDQAIKLGVAESDAFCLDEGKKVEEYVSTNGIYVDATIDFVSSGETFLSAQQAGKYFSSVCSSAGLIRDSMHWRLGGHGRSDRSEPNVCAYARSGESSQGTGEL